MSYRLGKWEYDHGLGLGFRFPVSLPPIHFTCETASFLRYAALRKHIKSIPHDYFLRGAYLRNEAVSHVKCMGGARRGIETLTLTHDHIPIYPVYNSCFPCVHAKGCVHDFPLGRGQSIISRCPPPALPLCARRTYVRGIFVRPKKSG